MATLDTEDFLFQVQIVYSHRNKSDKTTNASKLLDDIRFVIMFDRLGQTLCIQIQPLSHLKQT